MKQPTASVARRAPSARQRQRDGGAWREQEQCEQEQRERAAQWAEEQAAMRAEDARLGLP